MPKLPDATNLSGVNVGAPRSLVNIPVPDYAGAANAVAQGVRDVGTAVGNIAEQRLERARKQELFDTKMTMLKAGEAYAERVRGLDRLDPDYVEKSKAAYREVYEPILSNVQNPENRQRVEEEALTDYTNIGIRAGEEHKTARTAKTKIDLETYADAQVKRLVDDGVDPEKARASVLQMIENADLDALTKLELEKQLLEPLDEIAVETKANKLQTGGGAAADKTAAVLRNVEGFRATPYWDENAYRIGYGSDTITREDGTVVKVVQGMRITKADAERDLARRVKEFESGAARDSGEAWNNLSPDQQAALTSVAYNYGSLPKRVVKAIQTGDANTIANAVESLADHNGGINRKRREAEAAIIRGGASIPASWNQRPKLDDVLAQVEQDPAYLRLSVDKREKVKASIVSRYEKYEKEVEKDVQINTAREAANMAASEFTTLAEGNRWLDENVADPETREKARTMYKAEFDASEESRKTQYKSLVEKASVDVENAVNSLNDPDPEVRRKALDAAYAAIPAELDFKDQKALRDRIAEGPVRFDDQSFIDELDALKLGSKEDRQRFANYPLGGQNLFRLKRETREKILKEQEALRKQLDQGVDPPALASASELLKTALAAIKVTDPTMTDAMRRLYQRNLEIAGNNKGSNLTPSEQQAVLDQTFVQFRMEGKNQPFVSLPDVLAKFSRLDETQGVPAGTNFQLATQNIEAATARAKAQAEATVRAIESRARSPKAWMAEDLTTDYLAAKAILEEINSTGGMVNAAMLDEWLQRATGKKVDLEAAAAMASVKPGQQSPADAAEYAAAEERQRQADARKPRETVLTTAQRVSAARDQFGLDGMSDDEIIKFLKDRGAWPSTNEKAAR